MFATKLEAVNTVLVASGQAPVGVLDTSDFDTSVILQILDRELYSVCSWDLNFNRYFGLELTPDVNGFIFVPENAIKMDCTDGRIKVRTSQGKLFNIKENSFVFTKPVLVDIQWVPEYEDAPYPIKELVIARAARAFQISSVGSETNENLNRQAILEAQQKVYQWDSEQADYNVLDNDTSYNILGGGWNG